MDSFASLSRRKHGFDSRRAYHFFFQFKAVPNLAGDRGARCYRCQKIGMNNTSTLRNSSRPSSIPSDSSHFAVSGRLA